MVSVYYERSYICVGPSLIHSFNNLLGRRETTKRECDQICHQLLNPYNTNMAEIALWQEYDINVLNALGQRRSLQVQWFDARRIDELTESEIGIGIIVNFQPQFCAYWCQCVNYGRHWIAIRKVDDKWLDLDSNRLTRWSPDEIGDIKDLIEFLKLKLQSEDGQVFIIKH